MTSKEKRNRWADEATHVRDLLYWASAALGVVQTTTPGSMIHSDEERRLKDYLDEIDEELEQISALNPLRFRLIKRVQKFKYECQEAV